MNLSLEKERRKRKREQKKEKGMGFPGKRKKEKKGMNRRGLRGSRRLKMELDSVERMLRNVVQRMKSENCLNHNGFHASIAVVLQIVLKRSLQMKQSVPEVDHG